MILEITFPFKNPDDGKEKTEGMQFQQEEQGLQKGVCCNKGLIEVYNQDRIFWYVFGLGRLIHQSLSIKRSRFDGSPKKVAERRE